MKFNTGAQYLAFYQGRVAAYAFKEAALLDSGAPFPQNPYKGDLAAAWGNGWNRGAEEINLDGKYYFPRERGEVIANEARKK